MTKPLLAFSNLIVDHIVDADGVSRPPQLGGAGPYAAAAMRMWWPSVALIAGIGENFVDLVNDAFRTYRFDERGLLVKDRHCIESRLVYREDGSRTESPTFGSEHFVRLQIELSEIASPLLPAAGSYFFKDTNPKFWSEFRARRSEFGVCLWEVDCAAASRERLNDFASISALVDIISLNLAEAQSLFGGAHDPEWFLSALQDIGFENAVLRMGADGAAACFDRKRFFVRPPNSRVVDVTGGGNAFSGGLLAGLCRHPDDPVMASRCAAAAASEIIAQTGLPSLPSEQVMASLCDKVSVELI